MKNKKTAPLTFNQVHINKQFKHFLTFGIQFDYKVRKSYWTSKSREK